MQEIERDNAMRIAQKLYDRKGMDIQVLQVGHLTVLTDYMVIATGANALQVRALVDHVDEEQSKRGFEPRRVEGRNEGRWVVMDYAGVIVHVFTAEDRNFYRLERLWTDGQNRVPLPFDPEQAEDDPA